METLQKTKPVWHAVLWAILYVVIVNVGNNLSSTIGIENSATVVLLTVFSLFLLFYVQKNNWLSLYGFNRLDRSTIRKTLFYVPLFVMAFAQYFKGINGELGTVDILLVIVLMICVGFIEELLFRGFLLQGIAVKSGVTRAVLISGVTFGIGHIANLLQGYSAADQIVQIIGAMAIGIVLALIVVVTKNILPGVVFHTLFNISGSITNNNLAFETVFVLVVAVLAALYSFYLFKSLRPAKEGASQLQEPSVR